MATFLAVYILWQASQSKLFELFQQISSLLSRYMTCVIVEADLKERALLTVDQSLKCNVKTWPAGVLGTTQNYKKLSKYSPKAFSISLLLSPVASRQTSDAEIIV